MILENEKEIIKKAKKDIYYFDLLYKEYYPKINNFVFHRVHEESIKNEIVSNVFFKAMNKINLFRFLDSKKVCFSSWLYRIAINEINQYYRNRKRDKKIQQNYFENNSIHYQNETIPKINYDIVKNNLCKLKIEDQHLIALRYFEKMSYAEISEIVNKSEGALKVRVHRALKKLKEYINREMKNG